MPPTQQELENKIVELENNLRELEKRVSEEIDSLKKMIEELGLFLKNHYHSGTESSGTLRPTLVNSLKYQVGGKDPYPDGTYNFYTETGGFVASITIKSGIITNITFS